MRDGGGLDLAQVAGDVVAGEDFADLGLLLGAAREGVGAAGVEAAARRQVDKSTSAYVCCGQANRALGGVLDGLVEISRLGAPGDFEDEFLGSVVLLSAAIVRR